MAGPISTSRTSKRRSGEPAPEQANAAEQPHGQAQAEGQEQAEQAAPQAPPEPPKTRDGKEFPVTGGLVSIIAELRRPFATTAVRFRLADPKDPSRQALVFITGRLVSERLNLVCPADWSEEFEASGEDRHLVCKLTIAGVTHIDVGRESSTDGVKGMYSDARKRAAVHFGVGSYLHGLPDLHLKTSEITRANTKDAEINEAGLRRLRAAYDTWLQEVGILRLGDVLDHGDSPEIEALSSEAAEGDDLSDAEQSGLMKRTIAQLIHEYMRTTGAEGLEPLAKTMADLGINLETETEGDEPAHWAAVLPATAAMKLYAWLRFQVWRVKADAEAAAQAQAQAQAQAAQSVHTPHGKMAVPIPSGEHEGTMAMPAPSGEQPPTAPPGAPAPAQADTPSGAEQQPAGQQPADEQSGESNTPATEPRPATQAQDEPSDEPTADMPPEASEAQPEQDGQALDGGTPEAS